MEIEEDEASDLLETMKQGVGQRQFGSVVRLAVDEAMPDEMVDAPDGNLDVRATEVYPLPAPLAIGRPAVDLHGLEPPRPQGYAVRPRGPAALRDLEISDDIFAAIRRSDILLYHPYDTFKPVVDFINAAARDPDVLAIKQTLYRVGRNSPVVEALLEAQRNGKQVAVLVELKARFDEENNIGWARALEAAGVHVVYGLVGLKTHCKITLVVRREADGLRRYVHLATGNYNAVTAGIYTDIGLLTCDPAMAADATDLFNALTGYSTQQYYRRLLVAPGSMRERIEALIDREIEHHAGRPRRLLVFKMNSLVDDRLIRALYRASQAGVQVRPARARHLLPAARRARRQRQHPRHQRRRPLPGAQPHLLLRQRRRTRGLSGQRRSDAAQPGSPRRGHLPGQRSGDPVLHPRRDPRSRAAQQHPGAGHSSPTATTSAATGRRVSARSTARPGCSAIPPRDAARCTGVGSRTSPVAFVAL